MKIKKNIFNMLLMGFLLCGFGSQNMSAQNQQQEPWSDEQLLPPAELAEVLNDPAKNDPLIFSLGYGGNIKGTVEVGETSEKEGLAALKKELTALPKDAEIVIYCGCCPLDICPNVRPAFSLLNEMDFTNHSLLNLAENLKIDWLDKNYPIEDSE